MSPKRKIQIVVALLILGLLGTFLFLNRDLVEVDIIVAKVEMSRAVMVLAVFGSGFLLGWIFRSIFRVRRPGARE